MRFIHNRPLFLVNLFKAQIPWLLAQGAYWIVAMDPNLSLGDDGICNHCRYYEKQAPIFLKTGAQAEKLLNIRHVLGGHSVVTEDILPYHGTYDKKDYINIKAIHKKYDTRKLRLYPFLDRKMKRFIQNSGVPFIKYFNWIP